MRGRIGKAAFYAIVIVLGGLFLLPIYMMLKVSLSPPEEVLAPHPTFLLKDVTLQHWRDIFASGAVWPPLIKSVTVATFLKELYPYLSPDARLADWNTMDRFLANESVYQGMNWPFGIRFFVKELGKTEIKAYHGWAGPVKESHVLGGRCWGCPKGRRTWR